MQHFARETPVTSSLDVKNAAAIAAESNVQHAKTSSTAAAGGRGGIRTHGGFNPTLDFESSALNRTQPPFLPLAAREQDNPLTAREINRCAAVGDTMAKA